MRLNLGAGDYYREGWLNLDLRDDCGADMVQDVTKLPFDDGEVDEILALDLLEHFPAFRTLDILTEWRRVLVPGGLLTLKVPNLKLLAQWLLDHVAPRLVIRNVFGGHRWGPDGSWDAHHTGFTPETITEDLEQAGFKVIGNDLAVNMSVKARRWPYGDRD
jgi:ubiquinone/menaquinone biosynthesis C-methylase UbiE